MKTNFVGYDVSKNCMAGCKAIMDNYNVGYGGPNHVYQLLVENDGELVHLEGLSVYQDQDTRNIYNPAFFCGILCISCMNIPVPCSRNKSILNKHTRFAESVKHPGRATRKMKSILA